MSCANLLHFIKEKRKFLICVKVHKVKNLHILNSDIFIVISFDRKHKKTSVYESSDVPYFSEYFVFGTTCSLNEILEKNIVIRVVERRSLCKRNAIIGELLINLSTIWHAPSKIFILIIIHF